MHQQYLCYVSYIYPILTVQFRRSEMSWRDLHPAQPYILDQTSSGMPTMLRHKTSHAAHKSSCIGHPKGPRNSPKGLSVGQFCCGIMSKGLHMPDPCGKNSASRWLWEAFSVAGLGSPERPGKSAWVFIARSGTTT